MTTDRLRLTATFDERQRVDGRFVADVLMDLCAGHGIATSLLLRGTVGCVVALDDEQRMAALLGQLRRVEHGAELTVQRVGRALGAGPAELTVHLDGTERVGAACELLRGRGMTAATLLVGVDGTVAGERVRARFFGRNADRPLMIVAVGPGDRVAEVLPELARLLRRPVSTVVPARIGPPATGSWQWLTVHTAGPVDAAVRRRLPGATVLRGIWGFTGDRGPHRDRLFQLGRGAPVIISCRAAPDRVAAAHAALAAMGGVLTSEDVEPPQRFRSSAGG